ncbi:MAG: radical SAM protein [Candidatus Thermoplasmatota archaeon]
MVAHVKCKAALSPSKLPGLDWALNPYRGCSHGCLYCYVQDVTGFALDRPWGSAVEAKVNIAHQLKAQLERGVEGVVGVGTVTDPYQPAEQGLELTRNCLVLLKRYDVRISVLTKSDLVLRDLDLLRGWEGAEVGVSIGCPDDTAAARVEPGAPSPGRRFAALAKLTEAGVDAYLMAAPIVPSVSGSDGMLRGLVQRASEAGIRRIMWDGLNPKPVASKRMVAALPALEADLEVARSGTWSSRVRIRLAEECRSRSLTLVDAF